LELLQDIRENLKTLDRIFDSWVLAKCLQFILSFQNGAAVGQVLFEVEDWVSVVDDLTICFGNLGNAFTPIVGSRDFKAIDICGNSSIRPIFLKSNFDWICIKVTRVSRSLLDSYSFVILRNEFDLKFLGHSRVNEASIGHILNYNISCDALYLVLKISIGGFYIWISLDHDVVFYLFKRILTSASVA